MESTKTETIEIIPIKLNVDFNADKPNLNCLFFQPDLNLTTSAPFKIIDTNHGDKIQRLLELSEKTTENNLTENVEFILIPEYGINGIEGFNQIRDFLLKSSVEKQILIGGIDALARDEFKELLKNSSFEQNFKNKTTEWLNTFSSSKWFNVVVIMEKFENKVQYYLQTKLSKSRAGEQLTDMVIGKWFLSFSTAHKNPINFFTLICSDWMMEAASENKLITEIISEKQVECENGYTFAFVPQYNPKPNHYSFINSTDSFLRTSTRWKKIHNNRATVVMINKANKNSTFLAKENSSFAWSGFISGGNSQSDSNYDTVSCKCPDGLHIYKTLYFRENREAIHSISYRIPKNEVVGPSQYNTPFERQVFLK